MKAYPLIHKHPTSGQTSMSEGLDLRDWFAGLAMQGMMHDVSQPVGEVIAEWAYQVADAMMKAREVKHE